MFEDLVFTIGKTTPGFFPEILIPPRAANAQGPDHWGDAGSGGGDDGERGMAAVLSSALRSTWRSLLGAGEGGTAMAADLALGNRAVTPLG